MDKKNNNVVDKRKSETKEKKERNLPEFVQKIKSIKHIEIILAVIVIVVVVIAYTFTIKDKDDNSVAVGGNESDLTEQLTDILCKIDGVGDVDILILYNGGKRLEIASESNKHTDTETDGDRTTTTTTETDTPIIVDGDKPLIIGEKRAEIDGVIVVADGGGNNKIKVEIMRALSTLLRIRFDQVQVFKAA